MGSKLEYIRVALGTTPLPVKSECMSFAYVHFSPSPRLTWKQDKTPEQLHSRVEFVPTASLNSVITPAYPKLSIVALDCELVYTTSGMALARLTVVNEEGEVVLDEHVRPEGNLLDTNTRFSGVRLEHLEGASMDLRGVREALGRIIDEKTVLVGHGLENDLKAMRLIHPTCIDTAIVRPSPLVPAKLGGRSSPILVVSLFDMLCVISLEIF